MNEVKIYGLAEAQNQEEVKAAFVSAGISEMKQAGSGDTNFLPIEGEFVGFSFAGEGNMRHCVLLSEPAGHCSLSNLQAQAVFGKKLEQVTFEASKREDIKGSLFPVGSSKLNPQIPSSQVIAVQMLIGKKFKASVKDGIVQDYKADNNGKPIWETDPEKAAARLVSKYFWKSFFWSSRTCLAWFGLCYR